MQRVNKYLIKGLLFFGSYFCLLALATAQQYTQRDQAEIKYLAQLTLVEYESILNLISNSAISPAVLEEAVQSPYNDPRTKIFYAANVGVEEAVAPAQQAAAEQVNKSIQEYLQEFNEQYVKSALETVDFYNFQISNLKNGEYPYVRVKYTAHFKGRHHQDPAPYVPVERVATLRAARKGDRWATYIMHIGPYDPAHPIAATEGDEVLDATIKDDGTYAGKLQQLLNAQEAQRQLADELALAQSWRAFDDKRFAALRSLGEEAEGYRAYEKAAGFYRQALQIKPEEPGVEARLEARLEKLRIAIKEMAQLEAKYRAGDYVEAIKAYSAAIAEAPGNADFYFGRGLCYVQLNELQTAHRDFSTAIKLDNRFAAALSSRAQLYARTGQAQKALEDYNQIIASVPDAWDYYSQRASLKQRMGDLQGAIADYEAAIKRQPRQPALYYEMGLLQAAAEQPEQAVVSFSAAIQQDSGFANAYYARGMAYVAQQTISSAAADFERARKLGVKEEQQAAIDSIADSYAALGAAAMEKEAYSQALEYYIKRILLAPADVNAWIQKGKVHQASGDAENALTSYTKAVGLGGSSLALYHRGLLHWQRGEGEAAKHDFEKFVPQGRQLISAAESRAVGAKSSAALEQLAAEIAEGWYRLGNAQLLAEQYTEALASLERCLEINKAHPQALFAQGAAQLGLQHYKKAIRDIEKSLKQGIEDSPYVYLALGDAYKAIGQTEYAISIYSYLIDSVNKNFDLAYTRRAAGYQELKQYAKALQDLSTAMVLNDALNKDARFITNKGLIELYESRLQEASQSFDQALTLAHDNAWALYGKASVLASQNRMEESLEMYRKAFQTGKIEWSAIKDDPIIKHVSKQKAFKELVDASLRL